MSNTNNKEKLHTLRHSAEHVMHQAIKELYPQIHLAMGPATEEGFYNDFDSSPKDAKAIKISEEDFPKIEKRMQKLINLNLPINKMEISEKEARDLFKNNPYKLEWIDDIAKKGKKVIVYWTGKPGEKNSMVDLCSGPHVKTTGEIKHFKLLSVAGAYWHGDEKNKMLTRIYGTAFFTKEELDKFIWQKEEAKKRDHKKIGKEMDLFLFDEEFGQGLPLYMPNGAIIRKEIMDFAFNTYLERGYQPVSTPHIANLDLWKHSGHWQFYRDSMYSPMKIDKKEYVLKPMNCPGHVKIYNSRKHSYRKLPIRYAEMGTVYRYEKSGELNGILRPRCFTQDDAHIICTPDQLNQELIEMINLTKYIYDKFGFKEPTVSLSIRGTTNKEKYLGQDEKWHHAENALENALQDQKIPFEKIEGEAAFYGPKIDFMFEDVLDRKQQLTTIQVDFNLPEKFRMTYVDKDNQEKQPFMLHRALLGSLERFMGVLIEHHGGTFPVWLSPIQTMIIPISQNHAKYAQKIAQQLRKEKIRVEIDNRDETMQARIRDTQVKKIPYMIILGDREVANKQISVRLRSGKQMNAIETEKFIQRVQQEIIEKEDQ